MQLRRLDNCNLGESRAYAENQLSLSALKARLPYFARLPFCSVVPAFQLRFVCKYTKMVLVDSDVQDCHRMSLGIQRICQDTQDT